MLQIILNSNTKWVETNSKTLNDAFFLTKSMIKSTESSVMELSLTLRVKSDLIILVYHIKENWTERCTLASQELYFVAVHVIFQSNRHLQCDCQPNYGWDRIQGKERNATNENEILEEVSLNLRAVRELKFVRARAKANAPSLCMRFPLRLCSELWD